MLPYLSAPRAVNGAEKLVVVPGYPAMTTTSTLRRFTAACAVAVALCFAQVASAQGFKWWQAEPFIKELGLTQEQTRRLEEVWQKALPGLKAQKTTLDAAEAKFERLIERSDPETMEQINVVEAARAELNKSRNLMLWNMRQLLTDKQWAKFTALQQAAEKERGERDRAGNTEKRP
jgi:Spy/CpxP family protein refolding chaperone